MDAMVRAAEDAVAKLDALEAGEARYFDNENAHVKADDILLEFLRGIGIDSVADAYERVRAHGFWYA